METSRERLAQFCTSRKIQRFEPDEIVELLEDGESVEWIVEQLDPAADAVDELTALLGEIAEQVGPEPEADADDSVSAAADEAAGALADLGDIPLPPGVDIAQVEQLLNTPQGAMLTDFSAFCQERGVDADALQEGEEGRVRELYGEWLHTPRESLEGKKPADVLDGRGLFAQKVETYRREQPKVGRNDPCPCGSGRKYKKCCGRGG